MQTLYIAERYAQALYEVSGDSVENEVIDLMRLLNEIDFVSSTRISKAIKFHIVKKCNLSDYFANLLILLIDSCRTAIVREVLSAYLEKCKDGRGELDAIVNSYLPLTLPQRKKLADGIKTYFPLAKKINIIQKVDQSVLGGFTIKVRSKIIDLSIRRMILKHRDICLSEIAKNT